MVSICIHFETCTGNIYMYLGTVLLFTNCQYNKINTMSHKSNMHTIVYAYLSMPMAVLVKILTATLRTCMNRTRGHISLPNTQYPSMDLVKVNGIQKQAMHKSAIARFNRYLDRSVFDLVPRESTMRTRMLPMTDIKAVKENTAISAICASTGNSNCMGGK